MSAVITKKKRERQPMSQAPARHSGEGRNPVAAAFNRAADARDQIGDSRSTSLPNGWRWATLGDTGRYINGVAFKPSDWGREGLPIIRIQNLTDPKKPLNRTTREVDPIYRVETGDLLVSWSATLDAFLWDRETGLLNQHIFKVVPDESVVEKRFLFYLLRMAIAEMIKSEHLHGSTMKHINRGPFLAHEVLIPPLNVQEEIVADIEKQFTRLDVGVAALRRVQANLKRYRAAVLKAACEGRLVPTEAELAKAEGRTYETGEELLARILADRRKNWDGRGKYKEPATPDATNLAPLPSGWAWSTAEQLSDENRSITYGVIKLGTHVIGGVPVLRSSDVRHLRLDLEDVKVISPDIANGYRRTFLRGGEVLVTVRGTLGGVTVAPTQCAGFNISREVAMLAFVEPLVAKATAIFIGSSPLQRWLMQHTKGIAYTGINIETLKKLPIPLPPLMEQARIVAEVERRLSVIEELDAAVAANLQRATRLRQSVLRRAFE